MDATSMALTRQRINVAISCIRMLFPTRSLSKDTTLSKVVNIFFTGDVIFLKNLNLFFSNLGSLTLVFFILGFLSLILNFISYPPNCFYITRVSWILFYFFSNLPYMYHYCIGRFKKFFLPNL